MTKTVAIFQKLADSDQNNTLFRRQLANVYELIGEQQNSKGDFHAEIEFLNQAIRLEPAFTLAWNWRCWYIKLGQWEEALSDCNEALRLAPNDANTLGDRGLVELKLEQYGQGHCRL